MEAAAPPYLIPRPQDITPELRLFLDARFRSPADLAAAADVQAEIRERCAELEASVSDLSIRLVDAATAYSSSLGAAGSALCGVRGQLAALKTSTSQPGVREEVDVGSEKTLYEQLPALANEVARVAMVRDYAGISCVRKQGPQFFISRDIRPAGVTLMNDDPLSLSLV